MKKISLFILFLVFVFAVNAQYGAGNSFRIYGKITGLKDGWVRIKVNNQFGVSNTIDSIISKNGDFLLKGKVEVPDIAHLEFEGKDKSATFFIENSDIQVLGNADSVENVTITGCRTQFEYEKLIREMKVFAGLQEECNTKYSEAQAKNDIKTMELYDSISNSVFDRQILFLTNYAFKFNKSVVAPYIVITQLLYYIKLPVLDSITANFDKAIAASYYVKKLKERVAVLRKVDIGQPAVEIELADTAGNMFALSSLNGKYVLIDFWASWCSPCRKENPNVVKAYQMFKDKGFDILGVSMDQNRKNWLKAIKDDNLSWHQISDLKGWGCEGGKLYGVNSIPHSVLIGRDGKIIAKDLRGEELLKKLAELMP
jgi:peroxiredoxin